MKKLVIAAVLSVAAGGVFAADEPKPFTLDGEFGLNITTGNTETSTYTVGLNAQQELENWSNTYLIDGLYKTEVTEDSDTGEDVDSTSAHKFFASAQGNYKLENPDHRLFIFSSYEDDRLSSYDYQATLAAGWSQKMWSNETSSFEYSIGPGYSWSKTQGTQDEESVDTSNAIIRGSLAYNWFISKTAKFSQTFSTEMGSENTKSRAESSLTASISGALSLKVSVRLDHNTDVDDDYEKLDTETAITLVYNFF